jgi:hypothetical protein
LGKHDTEGENVPTKLTRNRIQEFIGALKKSGGNSGNGSLRQALGWDDESYWRVVD